MHAYLTRVAAPAAAIAALTVALTGCTTTVPGTAAPAMPVATAVPAAPVVATTERPDPRDTPSLPGSLADQIVLAVVRDGTTTVTQDDAEVIRLAGLPCRNLDVYPTQYGFVGTVQGLADVSGWSQRDAAYVVGAAITAYCPEHADLIG